MRGVIFQSEVTVRDGWEILVDMDMASLELFTPADGEPPCPDRFAADSMPPPD